MTSVSKVSWRDCFFSSLRGFYVTNDVVFLVVQPPDEPSNKRRLKLFCTEDEQSRLCWITGLRFFKVLDHFVSKRVYQH